MFALVVTAFAVVIAVGCGSKSKSHTSDSTTSTSSSMPTSIAGTSGGSGGPGGPSTKQTSTTANGIDRCHTSGLRVSKSEGPGGAAAGHLHLTITFTNTGTTACRMEGYAGFGLRGAQGSVLPSNVIRGSTFAKQDPGPSPIILAPGASASTDLAWSDVPTGADNGGPPCAGGVTALLVTPPDETQSVTLPFSGPVCGNGEMHTTALQAG